MRKCPVRDSYFLDPHEIPSWTYEIVFWYFIMFNATVVLGKKSLEFYCLIFGNDTSTLFVSHT